MGSFLDKPITEKETAGGSGNGLVYSMSCMQGWRSEMEVGGGARGSSLSLSQALPLSLSEALSFSRSFKLKLPL